MADRELVDSETIGWDFSVAGEAKAEFIGDLSGGGGINTVNQQVFTASDTYVPTTGMVYCVIEAQAPGGGGGGADSNGASGLIKGGGGGGGEYRRGVFDAAAVGASKSVTIGALGAAGSSTGGNGGTGGTTSVGSLLSAIGGTGGTGTGSNSSSSANRAGGAGGTGGTGGFGVPGRSGNTGVLASTVALSAGGGDSFMGYGARDDFRADTAAGSAGTGFGGGGSGGACDDTGGAVGGAGAAGIVIITEYISAP